MTKSYGSSKFMLLRKECHGHFIFIRALSFSSNCVISIYNEDNVGVKWEIISNIKPTYLIKHDFYILLLALLLLLSYIPFKWNNE